VNICKNKIEYTSTKYKNIKHKLNELLKEKKKLNNFSLR
jgi:hypothetical protein